MGKRINKILAPTDTADFTRHIAIEDMARLAEGNVDRTERENLVHHINRCSRCYEILQETAQDLQLEDPGQPAPTAWWKTKTVYALAASILLFCIIGGQFVFKRWIQDSEIIMATLELDQELKDILLDDDALRIGKGARLDRLIVILRQKGLQIENLDFAQLSTPYYQKKSLFGPREILHIRIENNVAFLEVKETN